MANESSKKAAEAMRRWYLPGVFQILSERSKQLKQWEPDHDDSHTRGQLLKAAKSYIDAAAYVEEEGELPKGAISFHWPWERWSFKPSKDPIKNLRKAGALIAAEIDRLERKKRDDTV